MATGLPGEARRMSVSIANVTFTGFTGAGFAPTPGTGQLDSDFWRVVGASDGTLDYGGTQTGGDFARGGVSNASNPTAGGVYAASYGSPTNTGFVIQPSAADFTSPPGTVTFRVQYTGPQALNSLTFDYDALFRNNEARSTAVSFSYAVQAAATQPADSGFTTLAPLNYATGVAADALGFQTIDLPAQTVSASVAANSYIFLRWSFTENGGSGSRDEVGFDNILVTGTPAAQVPTVSISPATLSLAEGNGGTTAFSFTVTRSSTSGGDVVVPVTLAGGTGFTAADFASITVGGSTVAGAAIGTPFDVALSGSTTSVTVIVNIAGDTATEADETFTLALADPGAAYDVGTPGSATATVVNDDVTPTVSISPATLSLAEGNSGTTAFSFTVSRSSTSGGDVVVPVTLTGGTGFTAADFASITVDGNTVAGAAIGTPFDIALTGTSTAVTVTVNIVGDSAAEGDESFTLTLTDPGTAYDLGAQASATGTVANDDVALTAISAIQGSGRASASVGQAVTIEGVVTGDFQTADADAGRNLGGFFVQALAADGNPLTSDGIFVFQNDNATLLRDVQVGDIVRVTGAVMEFARFANQRTANLTETQIEVSNSTTGIQVVTAGAYTQAQVNGTFAVDIDLPSVATLTNAGGLVIADLEQYEGMLVRFPNTFTISEGFNLDRFNEIRAIEGAQAYQYTQDNLPSVAGNQAYVAEVASRTITIDDGLRVQNAPPTLFGTALTTGNTPQIGDSFSGLVGNVRFGDGSSGTQADNLSNGTSNTTQTYRILPQNTPTITDTQTRDAAPGRDGGDLKVASANLLNYFVTLGTALTGPPGQQQSARGATNSAEFARQQEKLFTALEQLDADVIVLNEIENNGFGTGSAIRNLVDGLNAELGTPGRWAFVNPNTANGFLGGDAISVGMIYRTDKVQLAQGSSAAVLDDSDIAGLVSAGLLPADFLAQSTKGAVFNGADTSRAVLVTSFQEIGSGEVFTLAGVHNKSKSGTGSGADADAGDGAGNWNNQRLLANQALDAFLRTNPTGIADPDVLLMGDFNSYARENSIRFLTDTAGWNNLIAERIGADAFSFVFDGFRGYLDYAFATDSIEALVRGVHEWNVNAPEFDAFDYNTDFGRPAGIYDGSTPWRYSDHDPVVVNLLLDPGLLVMRAGATVFVSNSFAEATATALAGDTVVLRDQPRVADWAAGTIAKGGLTIDLGDVGGAALSLAAGATSVGFLGSAGFALDGSAGGDLIQGNAGANDIEGLGGNDAIAAGGGDDTVDGAEGNDQIEGGAGNDRLFGGSDNDVLTGGEGNDLLDGDAGIDTASYAGAAAAVRVQLNLAGPQQTLGAGMDTLAEIENLIGSAFNDSLVGTTGGNTILGGDGADSIRGLAGADLLEGGAGNDSIRGDAGAQTIAGGDGNDLLFGAAGADRFVFDQDDGADRIADFLRSQGDRIVLTGGSADELSFAGTQFTFGATSVQLVNAPALIAADFLFA